MVRNQVRAGISLDWFTRCARRALTAGAVFAVSSVACSGSNAHRVELASTRGRAAAPDAEAADPRSGDELLSAGLREKADGHLAEAKQRFQSARAALEARFGEAAVLEPNTGIWQVSALGWSADGSRLAAAAGSVVHVLNGSTFEELRRFEAAESPVSAVAFSADGRLLASSSGSRDGSVELWDVVGAVRRDTIAAEHGALDTLVFNPDGSLLAGRRWEENSVPVWRVTPPGLLRTLSSALSEDEGMGVRYATSRRARPEMLAFRPHGSSLLGVSDERLFAWDLTSESPFAARALAANTPDDPLYSVASHPTRQLVAAGTEWGKVLLWDLASGENLATVQAHDFEPHLAFSRDGQRLLSVSTDGSVRVFTADALALMRSFPTALDVVEATAAHPDARAAAFGGGGSLLVRDVGSGELTHVVQPALPITALAVSPGAERLAFGTQAGGVVLIDTQSGGMRWLAGHLAEVTTLSFSPRGDALASASLDKTARLWDVAQGTSRGVFVHATPLNALAFGDGGSTLATAGEDGNVSLWDVSSGARKRTLAASSCALMTLRFSVDGAQLVANASDRSIVRFDTVSYARQPGPRRDYDCGGELRSWSNSLGLSPDGELIASAPQGVAVELWSARTGQLRGSLALESDAGVGTLYARSVAFSPRAPLLVAAAGPRLMAWSLRDGVGTPLTGSSVEVDTVAFTSDGRFLLGASHRGAVWLWSVEPDSLELSLSLSLALTGESAGFVRSTDGRVEWLGTGTPNASCLIGARVYPVELCEDGFAASGLMARLLARPPAASAEPRVR